MKLLIALTTALLLATLTSRAQAPLQNAMFTAGTAATDAENKDWAFLLFQLTADLEALFGRRLAVYQKPGGINDPGNFTHSGNVALQHNPAIIKVLLTRAEALGQPAGNLNAAINELFGELIPDPNIPVEEKLSAVIRGSIGDAEKFSNLMLLARMHPGVSLALGLAHAQKIPTGTTTFEIRETNLNGTQLGVVGRVAVTAKAPFTLIAPSPPVAVPETTPMGHLNARLRWAVPDDLRRAALLQYGFNVYGVNKAYAESLNWHVTPPAQGILAAAASTIPQIRKINRAPVLPTTIFNDIQALDLATDPKTFFIADDGGLASENPKPHKDGDRIYYFVAARDVLGRDGINSPGTEVTLLDRVPPNAPQRPEVVNNTDFSNNIEDHRLQVRWRQMTPTAEDPITGYFIYRWDNPTDVQKFGNDPSKNLISGFIPHVPGQTRLSFIDKNSPLSPSAPGSLDKTYWYTVRAFKTTKNQIGGVFSPNSAPAFGVLRNRFAPAAPEGKIFITCCQPIVTPGSVQDIADPAATDPLRAIFEAACTRKSSIVAWAEFALNDTRNPAALLGRFHFLFPHKHVRARLDLGRALYANGSHTIYCRVGDHKGNITPWVELSERDVPAVGSIRRFNFNADENCQQVELTETSIAAGCNSHSPGGSKFPEFPIAPADGDSPIKPIIIEAPLTERTREYRIYRRIDEGEMNLWKQGLSDEAVAEKIVLQDTAFPPNAGELAYFGQYLDDNGNASELKLIGKHVAVAQPAPQPNLSTPTVDGDDLNPRMKIRWFCPPHGVERFAVILGSDPGPLPNTISDQLSSNQEAPNAKQDYAPNAPVPKPIVFASYLTPSLESGFGPGPNYELSIPIHKGRTYQVQIRAIAKSNGEFRHSTAFKFQWPTEAIDAATGPNVPWPARPLPEVLATATQFDPALVPILVNTPDFNGVGLVIGQVPANRVTAQGNFVDRDDDPRSYLFPQDVGSDHRLMPMVVYRYQVPSEQHPNPSGDLIQVTPMMTEIATVANAASRLLRDPFIKILPPASGSALDAPRRIVLLDTQPAILFASYNYLIVTFNPNGEIRATYTVPTIHLEPTPQ